MRSVKTIILCSLATIAIFSSCANRLFVSEKKWKDMHDVTIYSNADNISVSNKFGENIGYLKKGENTLTIDVLKRYNKKLIFSHPDRNDTTIVLKRKVRGGALLLDFFIFYPAIVYDFAKADMYKLKMSSKVININLEYTYAFYEMEYKLLKNSNNPNDFMTYFTKYPNSPFKQKVENKMYELAYEKSNSLNTIDAYEKHNNDFPESPYKNEIQTKIYELVYNDALSKNTVDAYEKYITKYPNSPKVNEATQNKNKIKEIDEAYESAKNSNDYKVLKKFIESYNETKYHKEIAEKMLDAFCEENKTKLKNLDETNNAIKYLLDTQKKHKVKSTNSEKLYNLRDTYIANEIRICKTKTEFYTLLKNQCILENNKNDASENETGQIIYRIKNNKQLNINGTHVFWNSDGTKDIYNFSNGTKNGKYTKIASDEKTIIEKGNYTNDKLDGLYVKYFNNGKKQFEQNWNNDRLLNETEFDESGKNLTAVKEDKIREYIRIGDMEINNNNYELAIKAYDAAITLNFALKKERDETLREKYFDALHRYDQWKIKSSEKVKSFQSEDDVRIFMQVKSFQSEDDVRIFMQDKWFSNPNGLKIKYGYISEHNTYGISIKNKHNYTSYYINVNIQTMGSYAKLSGMSTEDGSNFKLRLYRDKIIVGYGEPGELTFTSE